VAAGAGAAEAPVLGYIAVGLLAALAWVCFLGLLIIWTHTFGALFLGLAHVSFPTGFFGRVHPLRFLESANNTVVGNLQKGADKSRHAMGYLFHGAAVIQGWIARELVGLAKDMYGWATWLQRSHLPRWLKAMIYALVPPLVFPSIRQWIKNLHVGSLRRDLTLLRRYVTRHGRAWVVATVAVAFPGILTIPKIWHGIDELRKWRPHVNKRLRRLEGLFGVTVFAGLMAKVLGVPNWRCLTRGNVGRAARFFCGAPTWLADMLLLGVVEAFVVSDLCRFTDLLMAEAEKIRPALLKLVDVEDALIGCHGTVKPIDFKLPPLSLPPMPGASALAA